MKKSILLCGFICILSILIISCNDSFEGPPISQTDIYNCHRASEWDATKIKNELLGIWEWEYTSCYGFPGEGTYITDEELRIEFRDDSTLTVTQNGLHIQNSTWKVVDGDGDLFEIEVEPYVDQLWGRILICENRVEFNFSYIDLCDNYFKKKE